MTSVSKGAVTGFPLGRLSLGRDKYDVVVNYCAYRGVSSGGVGESAEPEVWPSSGKEQSDFELAKLTDQLGGIPTGWSEDRLMRNLLERDLWSTATPAPRVCPP